MGRVAVPRAVLAVLAVLVWLGPHSARAGGTPGVLLADAAAQLSLAAGFPRPTRIAFHAGSARANLTLDTDRPPPPALASVAASSGPSGARLALFGTRSSTRLPSCRGGTQPCAALAQTRPSRSFSPNCFGAG